MLQRINNSRSADNESSADEGVPPPSPAAIAASVKQTPKHQALAQEIEKFSAERETVIAEMRAFIASNSSELNDAQIRKLAKRRENLEVTLRALRMEIQHHRDTHAAAIRAALQPARRDHAVAALHALAQLAAATRFLDGCEDAAGHAEGFPSFQRFQTNQGMLENQLRIIAEGGA